MDQKELDELLARYASGTCTPLEREKLKTWFDKRAGTGSWVWESAEHKASVQSMIKSGLDRRLPARPSRPLFSRPQIKIAAAIVLFALVGLLVFQLQQPAHSPDRIVYRVESTQQGEIKEVELPDGSIAILNASTALKFPEKFTNNREVTLENGEVYFQVKEDSKHPFVVTTGDVKTRVLGTAFNIRAYPFLEDVRVSLERGKVEVSQSTGSQQNHVLLLPNEQAVIRKDTKGIKTVSVDMDGLLSWKTGGMHFDHVALSAVMRLLEEKYGVVIILEGGNVEGKHLTADFSPSDSLHTVLDAIAATFGMKYTETDNKILLTFNQKL